MYNVFKQLPNSNEMSLIDALELDTDALALAESTSINEATLTTVEQPDTGGTSIVATFDNRPAPDPAAPAEPDPVT